MAEGVIPQSVPLCLDASQSRAAWWRGDVAVVVAVDKEGGCHSSSLQSIQDSVRVSVAVWCIIKGEGCSLQSKLKSGSGLKDFCVQSMFMQTA